MKLNELTMIDALKGLENKDFTAVELVKAYFDAMDATKELNSYITETRDVALKQAEESDKRRAEGKALPMDGLPIAMKDLFCTKGIKTTAASRMLENFVPEYESTVSQNLADAGVVLLGKVSNDEYAMGGSNKTSYFGPVMNPWKDKTRTDAHIVPGGSSGGSAAAVASFAAIGATGTDTGGSIRQPASFTGIVGMKPTYGRCSRWGVVAFASSLDQSGAMCRTVADTALMLENMMGFDPKDSTSVNLPVPNLSAMIGQDIAGMKIGIPAEYRSDNMSTEIKSAWDKAAELLKKQGAEIIDISLPHTKYAVSTYYIVAPAEASANLARYDGVRYGHRTEEKVSSLDDMYAKTRAEGFGEEVRRRILVGTYVLSAGYYDAYYTKAQKVRTLISQDFKEAFEKVDAILTPVTPTTAYAIEDELSPVEMYMGDVFTIPTSMAGLPGISVPVAKAENGLPIGVQLIGKAFDEETVIKVADALERVAGFELTPDIRG
ncbi:MAG: Asp-tRNA(Asn)/Glu-tRNA(Gln) amidotransferase subunit GatA [Alphaproteobacteria bacterium]|nr:Asp-tRNA(Asn)/Glu-tRNA(Gln) amidotransferase subunit GatA [Alphaproteobacteria bacterium]